MDKSKIYLDLSKCTEEEQKHVFTLLPDPILSDDYDIRGKYKYLLITDDYDNNCDKWYVDYSFDDKTEISLSQFKELFQTSAEDAQVEEKKCCDNPEIRWNKVEINVGDKQGSYLDLSFDFCDNCGKVFNEELS